MDPISFADGDARFFTSTKEPLAIRFQSTIYRCTFLKGDIASSGV